jgi:PAS domain S-box-containing protein
MTQETVPRFSRARRRQERDALTQAGRSTHTGVPLTRWVLPALLFEAALALAILLIGRSVVLTGMFLVAPLAIALVESPRRTALVGAVAVVLALISGARYHVFLHTDHVVRTLLVTTGAALAVLAAQARARATGAAERLLAAEHRLERVLASLAEAVIVHDPGGDVVYANDAALDLLDLSSPTPLRLRGDVGSRFVVEDEHGRPLRLRDLSANVTAEAGEAEPRLVRNVARVTGEERWLLTKASALHDDSGAIELVINVIEDVTAEKRAQMRARFLAAAGQALASSLDYQETLRTVAGLAVPQVADWCVVDLLDDEGDHEQVAVAHVDAARVALAERLREYQPDALDPERGLGAVLRTGRPELYLDIADELLVESARDAEHLQLLRELQMCSVLIVPMRAESRIVGAMTMVNAESQRRFEQTDVEFAQQIADRAAVAVENARLHTERTRIAVTLQEGLRPDELPAVPGWDLAALYRAAGRETDVGGDFYEVFPIGDAWLVLVGDVSGQGVNAAAQTALARHSARVLAEVDPRPAAMLRGLDRVLRQEASLTPCTAVCLNIGPDSAVVASGGHPLPIVCRNGDCRQIGRSGTVLGAFGDGEWPEERWEHRPGDTFVIYTDGVTETRAEGSERFGETRLREALGDPSGMSAAELIERIDAALTAFRVGASSDDAAVVVLRRLERSHEQRADVLGARTA